MDFDFKSLHSCLLLYLKPPWVDCAEAWQSIELSHSRGRTSPRWLLITESFHVQQTALSQAVEPTAGVLTSKLAAQKTATGITEWKSGMQAGGSAWQPLGAVKVPTPAFRGAAWVCMPSVQPSPCQCSALRCQASLEVP